MSQAGGRRAGTHGLSSLISRILNARVLANTTVTFALAFGFAVISTAALVTALNSRGVVKLAIAGAAFGIAAIVLSGNPRLTLLYGLVLSAPLDLSKRFTMVPHMGGASALRIEVVDFFVLGLLFFLIRDYRRGYRTKSNLRFPAVSVFWIVLILLGCVSIVMGPYRKLPLLEVFRMLKCLALFLVVVNELVRVKQIHHFVIALMGAVLTEAIVALAQFGTGRQFGLEALGAESQKGIEAAAQTTLKGGEAVYRTGALLGHSNMLAAFLALLLPIGIALLFTRIDQRLRGFYVVTVVLGAAALLVTLSRTGWIIFGMALLGTLFLGMFHRRSRGRFMFQRLVIVVLIAVVAMSFSGNIASRLFRSDTGAVSFRWEWLGVSWKMIKAKPLLGHGLNTFVFQMPPYTKYVNAHGMTEKYGEAWPVVHNNYAVVWAEQGTIGFIAFLAFTGHFLLVPIGNLRRVKHETLFAINVGCLCGLGALTVEWLASFSLRMDQLTRMFWLVVALACAIQYWWRIHAPVYRENLRALPPGGEKPPTVDVES